jgi:ribosomal protein L11 methyltransferase
MPSRWLEISIRATAEAAEAVTALFEQAGHGGVVVEPEIVQGHAEDEAVPSPNGFSILRTYLAESADLEQRKAKLEQAVGILRAFELAPMDELQFRWLSEEDWANAWKQHYQVHRIGRRWVIKPRWQAYTPGAGDLVVELDPGMAFGTGLHPTTQLVLECLEELDQAGEVSGKALLDLGTGSGILAIGAARLGAASVLALDVEEVAARVAAQNAAANGSAPVVAVRRATLGQAIEGVVPVPGLEVESAVDGVLANIVARVIAERAPAIARALRPGGWLLASGIIVDREAEAAGGLAASGIVIERRLQRGDWVALQGRRRPREPAGRAGA